MSEQRLSSWKEIAAHLDVSVRTAQRWEATEGLPVRRHRHARLSTVYADAVELDQWWDSRPETSPLPSIVVLPFATLDRDEGTEIVADGLTEDLITALSQVPGIRVVARDSSFLIRDQATDVREVGKRLGVGNLLSGSLRRSGRRLRITAQLVNTADGCNLWAHQFDRELEDPFDLQEQLADAIVRRLEVRLLDRAPVRRRTRDVETYNTFLRGRFFWNRRTHGNLQRAIACFEDVIAREPDYAAAHAGLADCHCFQWAHGRMRHAEVVASAEAAVSRALDLDPTLSEAHTSLGLLRLTLFDLRGAEAAFERALELNPGEHRARHWRAMARCMLGRFDDALKGIEAALELNPFGATVNQDVGRILYGAGRYEEAIARLRHALQIAPEARWAPAYLSLSYLESGETDNALTATSEPFLQALVRARMGDPTVAGKQLEADPAPAGTHTRQAVLHLALGEAERAQASLERAARGFELEFLELCVGLLPLLREAGLETTFESIVAGARRDTRS